MFSFFKGMWATRKVDPFEGTAYPVVTFHLHIRRRSLYYFVNVLIPCVLISMLTVLSFSLPPESGEKLSFGTCIQNKERIVSGPFVGTYGDARWRQTY